MIRYSTAAPAAVDRDQPRGRREVLGDRVDHGDGGRQVQEVDVVQHHHERRVTGTDELPEGWHEEGSGWSPSLTPEASDER